MDGAIQIQTVIYIASGIVSVSAAIGIIIKVVKTTVRRVSEEAINSAISSLSKRFDENISEMNKRFESTIDQLSKSFENSLKLIRDELLKFVNESKEFNDDIKEALIDLIKDRICQAH